MQDNNMVNQKESLTMVGLIIVIVGCIASISAIYYMGPANYGLFWLISINFASNLLLWGCGILSRKFVYMAAMAIALLVLIQAINY